MENLLLEELKKNRNRQKYFYYKGFRIKNKYYRNENHIINLHFKAIKGFIDKNTEELKKLNKSKVCYVSGYVNNWESIEELFHLNNKEGGYQK